MGEHFGHAGKLLAEIWSSTVKHGHPVLAQHTEIVPVEDNACWRKSKPTAVVVTVNMLSSTDKMFLDDGASVYSGSLTPDMGKERCTVCSNL